MVHSAQLASIKIAHGEGFARSQCCQQLREKGVSCLLVDNLDEIRMVDPAILVLDSLLVKRLPMGWRAQLPEGMLVGGEEQEEFDADFYLPKGFAARQTAQNLLMAIENWLASKYKKGSVLSGMPVGDNHKLTMLAEIGIALSAEKHLATLLNRILSEGRKLACCDAASLFLVDKSNPENPELIFKLTQNASIDFTMRETRFRMDEKSIVGWVASSGSRLCIDDAYKIPESAPYQFNRHFDQDMGYRSISLLAIPMKNRRNEVIGVLQFLNRTKTPDVLLSSPEVALEQVIPFDESIEVLLRSLAGQSAVAIENRILMDSIRRLFDGFVQASVVAIEQRDPTTSGHSFRVADLCLGLADVLPRSRDAAFRDFRFSSKDLTSLRYAALLHDFGKVGVRESVLTKPKKLTSHQFEVLGYRVRLTQEHIRRNALEHCLILTRQGAPMEQVEALRDRAEQEAGKLNEFWERITQSNEPTILPEGAFEHLHEIGKYPALNVQGEFAPLLDAPQLSALSIPKGSLTEEERLEIQSHVTHTESFLRLIPWTPDLASIPNIAAAHHEKLDGSGYPKGLCTAQIPMGSKIMAVCDIYDALTASDRPYKNAVPLEVAFNILESEAKRGLLEPELVRLFIDAKVQDVIKGKEYIRSNSLSKTFHHHVCDFDLME